MKRVVVKYGGNAMQRTEIQKQIIQVLIQLKNEDFDVIVVHGGGPFIAEQLKQAQIKSEFVAGHRVTTKEALPHIEMALKGRVNGQLVRLFNQEGSLAIGLSGKDAQLVVAGPRINADQQSPDLGYVGDVISVNSDLIIDFLSKKITPIIACLGTGIDGTDYNINGDMMAGHIAGAVKADHFVILTDIDGLRYQVDQPQSHIDRITIAEAESLMHTSIQGGMLPKMEACFVALKNGAKEATILNGTKPDQLIKKLVNHEHIGTNIIA